MHPGEHRQGFLGANYDKSGGVGCCAEDHVLCTRDQLATATCLDVLPRILGRQHIQEDRFMRQQALIQKLQLSICITDRLQCHRHSHTASAVEA